MRLNILVVTMLWMPFVFAQVKVGDFAATRWHLVGHDGYVYTERIEKVITSINSMDASVIYDETEIDSAGERTTKLHKINKKVLYDVRGLSDPRQLNKLCASKPEWNGEIESVVVPSGTFKACKWTDSSWPGHVFTMWFGPVPPFGFIKSESKDNG